MKSEKSDQEKQKTSKVQSEKSISTTDTIRNAEKRLKRNLKIFGLKLKHLQKDGNCIFKAATAKLKEKITPKELRYKVYLHIKENMQHYGDFLEDKNIVKKIKEDGHWDSEAGDLIPYALANVLGRNLTIVTSSFESVCIPVYLGECLKDEPIFLAYLNYPGCEHYCATK
ncbi:uncharacterized protein LOC131928231 [Physella acuta]|uniref:uncharacterized protein LOC131928231 n=1 Tax=Physella acuta TaxID=109671 RepID=UPI0027DE001A|nr:uncharacterized protein LOC131928231 [Physella acuta]